MEKSDVLHRRLLIAVCAVCACVRVFLVWNTRFMLDPDAGVVALMAKHMAEGVGFPVFFYGQPYMGSLEPAVSAALFIIFGASELALCAGTALIGLCVLPVAYLWARDAAGRWAGLAALVFLALGPAGYFPYLVVPRGGYAVIILAGTLVLWLSARILSVETRRERANWRLFTGLGLAAGAGWWTSALEAAAIGTAGLLFLCVMRRRLAAWRLQGRTGRGARDDRSGERRHGRAGERAHPGALPREPGGRGRPTAGPGDFRATDRRPLPPLWPGLMTLAARPGP